MKLGALIYLKSHTFCKTDQEKRENASKNEIKNNYKKQQR